MSIKVPRLIQDRCGVYYFRLIVPLSWRHIVKKMEIRRSLRTKDVSIARQSALLLSAGMEAFNRVPVYPLPSFCHAASAFLNIFPQLGRGIDARIP